MKLKHYTYTFNFITHILVHLVIVNTLGHSCTLDMSVKIKCIIIIIINNLSKCFCLLIGLLIYSIVDNHK